MHYHLTIHGMSCQHCVNAITEGLRAVDPEAQVRIDLEHASAWIDTHIAESNLLQIIIDEGYEPEMIA